MWSLGFAKTHFNEVVKQAIAVGPQHITVSGKPAVVVISVEEFNSLMKPNVSFLEFMRSSPLLGVTLDLVRDKSLTSAIEF